MYLKYIRHKLPCGELRRGTLYNVHFQPNEKGGYNEYLTVISDAYEMPRGEGLPLPLVYPVGVARINGYLRLTFGDGSCYSVLHLIEIGAREAFFEELRNLIWQRIEVRMEVK